MYEFFGMYVYQSLSIELRMVNYLNRFLKKLGLEGGIVTITGTHFFSSLTIGIFWLYLASIVSVSDYGKIGFLLAIGMVLGYVSILGMNIVSMTHLPRGELRIVQQARWLVIFFSISVGIATSIVVGEWLLLPLVVGNAVFVMVLADFLGTTDNRNYFRYGVLMHVFQALSSIVLYYIIGIEGVLIGYTITLLIFCFPIFRKLKISEIGLDEIWKKKNFISHGYSVELSKVMTLFSDKLLIAPVFGFTIMGIYYLSNQFLIFFALLPIALFNYMLPRESQRIDNYRILRFGILTSILLSILFYFISPIIIPAIFPKYVDAIQVMQIMIFGLIPLTITYTTLPKLLTGTKSKYALYGVTVFLSTLYILLYVFGTLWGTLGLAIALVISLTIQAVTVQFLHWKSKNCE